MKKKKHQTGGSVLPAINPKIPVKQAAQTSNTSDLYNALKLANETALIGRASVPGARDLGRLVSGLIGDTTVKKAPAAKSTTKMYNTGGDISSVLGAASPLLSLIPGAAPFAAGASALSSVVGSIASLFPSREKIGGSPGTYADGGDISLSNQSFQVKGNPNVYDSEEYTTPNGPIKLDHNEVIKGSFAFSNRLRNPATGNTFAEDVAPIEKSTAKASKRSTIANDPISNNTISANERRTESIATVQETLATLLGKRNKGMDPKNAKALIPTSRALGRVSDLPDGKELRSAIERTVQGLSNGESSYQSGGSIVPGPNEQYMTVGGDYFYDPYGKRYLWRNPITGSYSQEDNPGFGTGKGFRPYATVDGDQLIRHRTTTQDPQRPPLSISQHLKQYPGNNVPYQQASPVDWEMRQFGQEGTTPGRTLPEVTISANRIAPPTSSRPVRTGTSAPRQPLSRAEEWTANMEMQRSHMATGQAPELVDDPFGFGISAKPAMSADQRAAQLTTPSGVQSLESVQTQPITNATTTATTITNNTSADPMRTTIGDIFQGVEVGSKFLQLLGGPEVEKPYLDRTQITKQAFDPRQALYQNQANFQAQSNNLQTSSAPLRRALQNSLYAKKLDADSQVLTQYQQLNNQATTQYQDRLSNRQRYNNQQMNYTDDINARNRGQFMNATQNAFTSLGNFGEALNTKRQNYDALNILRVMYPEVYGRITNAIR